MVTVLRPTRKADFISAEVFESLFTKHLEGYLDITIIDMVEWCQLIFGGEEPPLSLQNAEDNFLRHAEGYDYFCPGCELIPQAHIFMALRNRSGANIRLLLIAHAPGAYVMEWAMLRPLLVPGDLIIAPSQSGQETITFLAPELAPFIHVIHHPMLPLPAVSDAGKPEKKDLIVTLSRIDKGKLIHRQIEAMAILRDWGYDRLCLEIAGPLEDPATGEMTQYARALRAMIARLKLEGHVKLVGVIYGDHEKARLLARAKMLLYLSVTVEEAYPKASIEALGMGIPVIAAQWDGFIETVGAAGKLVPVRTNALNGRVDVNPAEVADAIEELLHHAPPAHQCREQANIFHPQYMAARYDRVLREALQQRKRLHTDEARLDQERAAPRDGLLAKNSILRPFLWKELFALSLEYLERVRRVWKGESFSGPLKFQICQQLLLTSTQKALEHFLADPAHDGHIVTFGNDAPLLDESGDFFEQLFSGVFMDTTPDSKEVCLLACTSAGRYDLLDKALSFFQMYQHRSFGVNYLTIELLIEKSQYDQALRMLNEILFNGGSEEFHHIFLRQFAQIGRKIGNPGITLARLQTWLARYPDSPDSGPLWLELAVNAAHSGKEHITTARNAFRSAQNLLGDVPAVAKVEKLIQRKSLLSLV